MGFSSLLSFCSSVGSGGRNPGPRGRKAGSYLCCCHRLAAKPRTHTTCFPFFSLKNHSEDQDLQVPLCLFRGTACENVTKVDVDVDTEDLGPENDV